VHLTCVRFPEPSVGVPERVPDQLGGDGQAVDLDAEGLQRVADGVGHRLHAARHQGGDGRPLVIVPGITTPAGAFAFAAAHWAAASGAGDGYVLDLRGRGLSQRTPYGTHRATDYAEDVISLIDHLGPGLEPIWRDVEPPALLLYGEHSPVVTQAGAQELARVNPRARVVEVTGCGHMVPWDNLGQTTEELQLFLKTLQSGPA
jgi:pimeloyl-ACP methyl ester carboxylesterase